MEKVIKPMNGYLAVLISFITLGIAHLLLYQVEESPMIL